MSTRREFLMSAGAATVASGLASLPSLRADEQKTDQMVDQKATEKAAHKPPPRGSADSCIFLWLGGGACHIDTWDPKRRGDGKKKPGSYYDAVDTAVKGVQVCEHLKRCAAVMDRLTLLRTVHHDVVDEHAAASYRLHVGRRTSGTVVYPSIGSVVSHERPARGEGVPAYVVIGYPSPMRGPGFLGARHGYLYLTETETGPNGLTRPADTDAARQARREALLGTVRAEFAAAANRESAANREAADYLAAAEQGFKLAGPDFMRVFDLATESADLRSRYGGEFGQRCLLARRLTEAGSRFVEVSFNLNFVNGTGWDTHKEGQLKQHLLIDQLDQAVATLIGDLEARGRLDKTLVVIATEFGRPPEFDAGGGRGHHSKAFSIVLAGGGLRHGRAIGVTDELGKLPLERPMSVPDVHATIYSALGIEPHKELFADSRPVPITDGGQPAAELFG